MAYTYFGSPFDSYENNEQMSETDDIFNFYEEENKKCILKMINVLKDKVIKSNNKELNIEVGVTIVHSICSLKCDICQDFPNQDVHLWYLLRIKTRDTTVVYVDLCYDRTYEDWNDYLENNTLPKGFLFYPQSGIYEEENYLSQNLTPPSRTGNKILSGIDLFGDLTNLVSGVLLAGGMVFPIMAPVLIPTAATIGTCSAWSIGRQVSKLNNLNKHNQSLVGKDACKHWMTLGISTLGVITAPLNAGVRTLELGTSTVMTTNFGKALSIIQKGSAITQCSLDVIRLTIRVINKDLSFKDLYSLRLDVFVVMGLLLPVSRILQIVEVRL